MTKEDYQVQNAELANKKQELHQIIDDMTNPKLVDYLLNLIKAFLELRS